MNETIELVKAILDHVEEAITGNQVPALMTEIRLARRIMKNMKFYDAVDAVKVIFEGGEDAC